MTGRNCTRSLLLIALPILIFVLGAPSPASASLIFDQEITVSGQGFGSTNLLLTFKNPGIEQGCVNWNGSVDIITSCPGSITAGAVETDKSQTLPISALTSLGIGSAGQLGIVFNPAQEGGANAITLNKIVLTFYLSSGAELQSFTWVGPQTFCCNNQGTGGAGQVFKLDFSQALAAQSFFSGANRIGLGAQIGSGSGAFGGNGSFERFYAIPVEPTPVPEPLSFLTIGSGLFGLGLLSCRRAKTKRS